MDELMDTMETPIVSPSTNDQFFDAEEGGKHKYMQT